MPDLVSILTALAIPLGLVALAEVLRPPGTRSMLLPARRPRRGASEPARETPVAEPRARLSGLGERLVLTSEALVGRLGALLGGRSVDADLLEELEALLFTADLGVSTAESLLESVRREASGADAEQVRLVM